MRLARPAQPDRKARRAHMDLSAQLELSIAKIPSAANDVAVISVAHEW